MMRWWCMRTSTSYAMNDMLFSMGWCDGRSAWLWSVMTCPSHPGSHAWWDHTGINDEMLFVPTICICIVFELLYMKTRSLSYIWKIGLGPGVCAHVPTIPFFSLPEQCDIDDGYSVVGRYNTASQEESEGNRLKYIPVGLETDVYSSAELKKLICDFYH